MTGGKTISTLQRMYRVTLGDGGKATKLHGLWYSFSWHFHRGVAVSERPLANLQNRLSTQRLHSMFPILLYQRALQYWGSSQKKSVINSQVLNLTVRSIFLFKQAFQIFSIFFNLGSIKLRTVSLLIVAMIQKLTYSIRFSALLEPKKAQGTGLKIFI